MAAGLSRRFEKGNKLLHLVDGKTILNHTLQAINQAEISSIKLVTGCDRDQILDFVPKHVSIEEVFNKDYEKGMTSSIQRAVASCDDSVTGYMICLADQMKIQATTYKSIYAAFIDAENSSAQPIVVPYHQGTKGNPVILSSAYRQAIMNEVYTNGCRNVLKSNKEDIVKVKLDDPGILIDIDRVEDLDG